MSKRIISVCLLIFVTLFLSACSSKDLKLNSELINYNINHASSNPQKVLSSINYINVSEYTILNEYIHQGLLVLRNDLFETGVFSITENKFLLPFDETVKQVVSSASVGAYIYVTYPDNTKRVYDIDGNIIVEKDAYKILNVVGEIKHIYDDYGNISDTDYFDEVTLLTEARYNQGITTPNETIYQIDINTGQRTVFEKEVDTYQPGDQLGYETLILEDLDDFGLKDYAYAYTNGHYHIYDTDKKLISQFKDSSGMNISARLMFGGSLFYQTTVKVPETEDDYTYVVNGEKYMMHTYKIDLKTGQSELLEVDFKINAMSPFKNSEGITEFADVSVTKITDHLLSTELIQRYLMNSEGKLLINIDGIDFNQILKLDDDTLYDQENRMIMDNELSPKFKLSTGTVIDHNEEIIITRHLDKDGIIDFDGQVLVPFNYQHIYNYFYEGKTIAHKATDLYCLISINNTETCIPDFFVDVKLPNIYITQVHNENNTYTYNFYNFEGSNLLTFTNSSSWAYQVGINNPFVEAKLIDFGPISSTGFVVVRYEL